MKKCVIYFDPSLTENEISQRIEAIRLIHGIEHIETPLTNQKITPPHPPNMGSPMAGNPMGGQGMNIPTEGDNSRHVINQALRWGLEQGIVCAEQIEQLEAQQLVELAMKLLDQMPEDKKRELGSSLQ